MIDALLLLPSPPALLETSVTDPVADLRAACAEAVRDLEGVPSVVAVPTGPADLARGVTEPLGHRVARRLLGDRAFVPELALPWSAASLIERSATSHAGTVVVVADGSARRHERAPGHLHPDAVPFDEEVDRALRAGDAEALACLDEARAARVWCEGAPGLRLMGEVARGRTIRARVSYADAPYGVAWWVARWDLG